tara:strand:- start:28962 stop:29963 length:1002 start_codon:yes stop_codon:yes gene_type:complete
MSEPTNADQYNKEKYAEQIAEAKSQIHITRESVVSWCYTLDTAAAEKLIVIESMMNAFPNRKGDTYTRIVYDIHQSEKRYGTLGMSLKSSSFRTDLHSLSQHELAALLGNYFTKKAARQHAEDYQQFSLLMDRIAALRFLGIDFGPVSKEGPVVARWFEAVRAYGEKCAHKVDEEFKSYWDLCLKLDDAMLNFNATAGKIRYRMVKCSYTLNPEDPLGPSDPAIKVVSSINRKTKWIRYNKISHFKSNLVRVRVRKQLDLELGRPATKNELDEVMAKRRPKSNSPWLTKEVIRACHLGRRSKDLLEAQKTLITVMQSWQIQRANLQALLSQKG